MKKSLLLCALALVFGISGVANAAYGDETYDDFFSNGIPLSDNAYARALNTSEERGFLSSSTLRCNSEGGIAITAPAAEGSMFEPIESYRIFISPYRVEQLKDLNGTVDNTKIISKLAVLDVETNEVTFNILPEELDPNTAYYATIIPLDMYNVIGTPSKEVCFQMNKNICMIGDECNTFDMVVNPTPVQDTPSPAQDTQNQTQDTGVGVAVPVDTGEHGAACAGMSLAHVSHTVNGDKLTLTWTAVDGDTVEIAILSPDEEIYKKIATVNMADEKYTYTMEWDGEQNFLLTNACGGVKYKADAKRGAPQPEEEIVTPATGPAENILYIAIAAIVLYGAYTVFFRKSDNQ